MPESNPSEKPSRRKSWNTVPNPSPQEIRARAREVREGFRDQLGRAHQGWSKKETLKREGRLSGGTWTAPEISLGEVFIELDDPAQNGEY